MAGDERTPLAADVSARTRGANPNDSTCVARCARPRHGATPPGCDTAVRGSGSCSVVWRQRSWTCSGTVTGSWPPVSFVEIQQCERRCCARCTVSLQESAAGAHRNGERAQGNSIAVPTELSLLHRRCDSESCLQVLMATANFGQPRVFMKRRMRALIFVP